MNNCQISRSNLVLSLAVLSVLTLAFPVCAQANPARDGARSAASIVTNVITVEAAKALESKWGIQITALRVSAAGNVIDFRYRVTDAEKASVIGNPDSKAELRDRTSGKSLHVPSTKAGPMRSTGQKLTVGRTYTALFTNPGKVVKVGNKVDIIIGDFRAENLIVGN